MIPEERLREAAQEAGRIIANRYPDPEACQHTFSPEFEAKMERLLRRAARRERLVLAQRVARRVACLLLVLLLGCGTWLGVDAQARERLLGWVSQQVEGSQLYFYGGAPRETPDPTRYLLAQAPEGYTPRSVYLADFGASHRFRNQAGEILTFGYLKRDSTTVSSNISFSTEGMARQRVTVLDETADFYQGEQDNILVWTQEDTLFYLDGPLSQAALIDLAEHIRAIP